jgi:hypothetical protein
VTDDPDEPGWSQINQRPWGPAKPPDADTIEIVTNVFKESQRAHPGNGLRDFWLAVANGEVEIPGSRGPRSD